MYIIGIFNRLTDCFIKGFVKEERYAGGCDRKGRYRPSARPHGRAEKQGIGAVAMVTQRKAERRHTSG